MFSRYVALGDSSTEGLDDPDGAGGWRGWADRFAEHVAVTSPDLQYANLAVRGRVVRQVLDEQLPQALALEPDLATVFAGVNDLLRRTVDLDTVVADLETMMRALVEAGATVLTATAPDPSRVMPLARPLRGRIADFNDRTRAAAARAGALVADVGGQPVASDPRLWSVDRLHANALGHERIAAALAAALELPGAPQGWADPLGPSVRRRPHEVARAEAHWLRRYFAPWVTRRVRGRSSGDGVVPKRPAYGPVA